MARKKYKIPDEQIGMFDFDTPSMPVLDVSRCEARLINHETAARMVETYHYAHRVPSIVIAIGMYVDGVLAGCLTYGAPPSPELPKAFGENNKDIVGELNRLFIYDWAGKNSESWLVGQSFKFVQNIYKILVSYADTKQDHFGYIYQATNWLYTGLSDPGGARELIIEGQNIHSKAVYNAYGTRDLEKLRENGMNVEVVEKSLKHRYVYFLGSKKQKKELRKALKWPVLPYPKREEKF